MVPMFDDYLNRMEHRHKRMEIAMPALVGRCGGAVDFEHTVGTQRSWEAACDFHGSDRTQNGQETKIARIPR
jgi:hypothetical protein